MRTSILVSLVSVSMISLVACGPGRDRNGNGVDGGNGSGLGSGSGSGSGSGNQDGCSDASKLVYVVDENNQFSNFDPATKTFHSLGTLSCPAGSATPFSMGVDRNTIAWVLFSDGKLYRVDILNNLACTKTNWSTQQGLQQFGMGFSTDQAGGSTDTLFVAGGSSVGTGTTSTFATLDTGAFSATKVGSVSGWPELTGNGNAELWGWFPSDATGSTTPRVEQINKTSGAPVSGKTYMLPDLQGMPSAWAFAFWGGDYWIFLQKDLESHTTVYQIDGTNGSIKGMTAANGLTIVGAGVSTCAPVVIQ